MYAVPVFICNILSLTTQYCVGERCLRDRWKGLRPTCCPRASQSSQQWRKKRELITVAKVERADDRQRTLFSTKKRRRAKGGAQAGHAAGAPQPETDTGTEPTVPGMAPPGAETAALRFFWTLFLEFTGIESSSRLSQLAIARGVPQLL